MNSREDWLTLSISEGTRTAQGDAGQPISAPSDQRHTYAELGQRIADRIAMEMPTFAAKFPPAELATLMTNALGQAAGLAPDLPAGPTAAQRGPDWIAEYGCPTWCVMDHATATAPDWHRGPTAEVTATAHGANARHDDPLDVLMSAGVVQMSSDPEAFGVETRIWFDTGYDTYEMDVTQTDRLINSLETFIPKLRALRAHLVTASAGDHPGNPQVKARVMAELDARIKAITAGTAVNS